MLRRVACQTFTDVSEVLAASIIRAMSKKCNIPEDSHLHTRSLENLKSHHVDVGLLGGNAE
jgi:hypothetical protein